MITRVAEGISVSKWRDKRDILFLSTKHRPNFVITKSRIKGGKFEVCLKPTAIADYNFAKTYIDISDQMKSYSDPTCRGVKWYRKLIIELFCNIVMVNSYVLYLPTQQKKMTITEFREAVAEALLSFFKSNDHDDGIDVNCQIISAKHNITHDLKKKGRCVLCYKKEAAVNGRASAVKLPFIHFWCAACPYKFLCLNCYNKNHIIKPK